MASAGGAAAAAARRRRLEEEEQMTQYTPTDLADDWEFKIVRSLSASFRNPANLQRLIAEEAQAGWVMLEKFDDMRVRFKRRRSARATDSSLPAGYDPYRTRYGMGEGLFVLLIVGGIVLGMAVLIAIASLFEG